MSPRVPGSVFGLDWSQELARGSEALGVPPAWVLAVLAYESGFNPLARNASGAFGLWQKMPARHAGKAIPYTATDPIVQLSDAFRFWTAMARTFAVPSFTSRGAFYCLNLAPARLRNGDYNPTTIVYAREHGAAYNQNKQLDRDGKGAIVIGDLEHALDSGVRRCQARYDAELEMVEQFAR